MSFVKYNFYFSLYLVKEIVHYLGKYNHCTFGLYLLLENDKQLSWIKVKLLFSTFQLFQHIITLHQHQLYSMSMCIYVLFAIVSRL